VDGIDAPNGPCAGVPIAVISARELFVVLSFGEEGASADSPALVETARRGSKFPVVARMKSAAAGDASSPSIVSIVNPTTAIDCARTSNPPTGIPDFPKREASFRAGDAQLVPRLSK